MYVFQDKKMVNSLERSGLESIKVYINSELRCFLADEKNAHDCERYCSGSLLPV